MTDGELRAVRVVDSYSRRASVLFLNRLHLAFTELHSVVLVRHYGIMRDRISQVFSRPELCERRRE